VPVLLYHAVGCADGLSAAERRYLVTRRRFEEQLAHIARHGSVVLPLADVWRGVGGGPGSSTVTLTFDDGRASDYDVVFPLLQARDWRADFFVNPATVGQGGRVSWAQVRQMSQAGMRFQSHGYDHVDLSRLRLADLRHQLRASKQAIEHATGARVEFLAAPFGALSGRVVETALEEGYRAVCTSWAWPARPATATVGRVPIDARTDLRQFDRLVERDVLAYWPRTARTALLAIPKQVLGRWPSWLGAGPLEWRRG
jgi:peptidoglycan/xylan/chitin deacetylase (PgdA/CDA1 family)